jgi:hypothetical protein
MRILKRNQQIKTTISIDFHIIAIYNFLVKGSYSNN